MTNSTEAKVKLFACGGAGCNIGKLTEGFRNTDVPGFSQLDTLYIDTSESDFDGINPDHIYKFKDKDGSGGLRKQNASVITKYVQDILQNHKPKDLNIVLSSASGGSGSVAAPVIVSELLKRNENVVVITVGSVDTRLHINNTLNTLKSFENISKTNNKSLVVKYLQNESSSKTSDVDGEAKFTISALCMLFSGKNKGLDSQDLKHWLNFDRVSTYDPQMVFLETVSDISLIKSKGNIVSVASLSPKDGNTDLGLTVDVQYIGYVPDETPEDSKNSLPVHFVTTDARIEELNKTLTDALTELNNASNARVKRESILSDDDEVTDSGLVL